MGKVLVIPDVHLKAWMFDEADKIDRDSYDGIVVLGDLVYDWGKGNDIQAYEDIEEAVEASGVLSLDLFSTYSDGTSYGNRKFYIVDTENKTYKEAE